MATSIRVLDFSDFSTGFDNGVCDALIQAVKSNVLKSIHSLYLPMLDYATCDRDRWKELAQVIDVHYLPSLLKLTDGNDELN